MFQKLSKLLKRTTNWTLRGEKMTFLPFFPFKKKGLKELKNIKSIIPTERTVTISLKKTMVSFDLLDDDHTKGQTKRADGACKDMVRHLV